MVITGPAVRQSLLLVSNITLLPIALLSIKTKIENLAEPHNPTATAASIHVATLRTVLAVANR